VLRACRRLLRPGGRLAFFTITVAPGLDEDEHRRAVRIGPRAVSARREADALMTQAGFTNVETEDVTQEFETTARLWHREYKTHEEELRRALGAEYDGLYVNRADMISGLEDHLLERWLVVGTQPD
jgi:cyclopropane fatty-acyl-phospholipid synthase-like methyltransferase